MTHRGRIIRNTAIGIGALAIIAVVAAGIVVRSAWFRNDMVRDIVSSVEESSGGRAEIGSFEFDPTSLRATIGDLVIHGREPSGSPPLLRVRRIVAQFRLFTHLAKLLDVRYLGIENPEASIQIMADGGTNIPSPKQKTTSRESPLQSVVDLAVGRFELTNGFVAFESHKQPLSIHAQNLRAQLDFNILQRTYAGQVSLQPVYVVAGRNAPATFSITLPVTIGSDRVDLHGARVSSAASSFMIDASLANLKSPEITARINGSLAATDLKNLANIPEKLDLNANVSMSMGVIRVSSFDVKLGNSTLNALGASDKAISFRSTLDLAELGRLIHSTSMPAGRIGADGNIKLDTSLRNLYLTDFNLDAFGGRYSGSASLQDYRRYKLDGSLRHFDVATVLRALHEQLPYDGVLSGSLSVEGDTQKTRDISARARLSIAPGKRGRPVSGIIDANYDGASGNVTLAKSFLALPHSRLDLSGSLNNSLSVSLKSQDLTDFPGTNGLDLRRGEADFSGAVTGALTSPRITGHLAVNRLVIEGREFDSLAADVAASDARVAVRNGSLIRTPMRADFSASAGLAHWKPLPREPLAASVSITQGDLADIVALAGVNPAGYAGQLQARADIGGTIGDPSGTVTAQADNGRIDDQPFDEARLQVNLTDQLVTVPAAYIRGSAGRIDLSANFRHPRDSFTTGHLRAAVRSNDIDLSKTRTPNAAGAIRIDTDVTGDLNTNEFLLTAISGNASARALRFEGQDYGDAEATARTSGNTVAWNLNSDFAGSSIKANGRTQLVHDYPTSADATIGNLSVDKTLIAVQRTDIPARGTLGGTIHFTGTIHDPQANVNLTLTRGALDGEPIDELRLRGSYLPRSIDVSDLRVASGPSRIELTARYDHPAGDLRSGNARFNIESSRIDLARIRNLQTRRPGIAGTLQLSGHGDAAVIHGEPYVELHDLAANLSATGISVQGKSYGDLKLSADSTSGNRIEFALDSDLAGASIHGRGTGALTAGYPVDAQITFSNVLYSHFANLLGQTDGTRPPAEIAVDGQATVNGPVLRQNELRANLQLTRLTLTATQSAAGKPVAVENQGPIVIAINQGQVRIQSAHIAGAGADLQATGSASLTDRTLDFTVNGKAGLDVLPRFDRDIYSSGQIDLAATIRGNVSRPLVNGQMTLKDAAINYAGLPAGLSKANGQIVFDGNAATARNLTAEVGGGRVTLGGFVGYSNRLRFAIQMKATRSRMRVEEGMSVTASADLQMTGSDAGSVVSGTAVVDRITYNPHTDIGALLSRATPVVQSSSGSPLLEKMKLDIRIRASSGLSVQAELAEDVSATIDLHVQGTALQPGMLGRITITEGKLVFFGANYTVNTGVIAFYSPSKIEPIVDLSLQTEAQGVDVTVRITGPVDNLKLGYSSNPPLQFEEIVSLLAAGKTPTSDPTLLANQPTTPAASMQQTGESALLGEAVANPVANRLQRVFGISQLNLAPAFQSGTGSQVPTARLTLQQRVTSNLTFTYTSALDDPNGEIVSVQWTFDPKWSAVATRDQNGIFSINFFYKRQFR